MGRPKDPNGKTKHPDYWGELNHMRRYGITSGAVKTQITRQRNKCLGCTKPFSAELKPRVDHDHQTNRFRGVLCHGCNVGLGFLKENKDTLRRLMAYLDYDLTKKMVYLIGSLRNKDVQVVAAKIREAGWVVWDDWQAAGPEADDYWRDYEKARGRTYPEALAGNAAQNTYHFDKAYIDLADVGVLVMPAGRSGHLELGYMQGSGKPTYVLLDQEPERFDVMYQFASAVCHNVEELLENLSSQQFQESGENAVR